MQTTIITKDNLLDEVIARYDVDPMEVVDGIRDEIRATYDMLDGWQIDAGSAADQAVTSMTEALDNADPETGDVVVSDGTLREWRGALENLHGDVSTALADLYQTKDRLADYDEEFRK